MFQYLLAFVLFYAASADNTYGVSKPEYTPEAPSNVYDAPANTYGAPGPVYQIPDYYPEYDNHHREECRKPRTLHISGQPTRRPSFGNLDRNGENYLRISCPNDKKPYALVVEKYGKSVTFDSVTLTDKTVLATGYNLDFVARCRRGRLVGDDINRDRVTIKRVTCLELSAPININAL